MRTVLRRFGKFTLVGAIGMAVQLGSLAMLQRLIRGHDLWATAIALEITLLHNVTWHIHYTWADRVQARTLRAAWMRPLLRFHLSNGLVSMAGNLGLTALLVKHTPVPLVVSNLIAIACCSALTFCLGNLWAFASKSDRTREPGAAMQTT